MKRSEYMHCSAQGTYWVPCDVVGEDHYGDYTVTYIDPIFGDEVTRNHVNPSEVRWVDDSITEEILNEAAVAAALVFREKGIELTVDELEAVAAATKAALLSHFHK